MSDEIRTVDQLATALGGNMEREGNLILWALPYTLPGLPYSRLEIDATLPTAARLSPPVGWAVPVPRPDPIRWVWSREGMARYGRTQHAILMDERRGATLGEIMDALADAVTACPSLRDSLGVALAIVRGRVRL